MSYFQELIPHGHIINVVDQVKEVVMLVVRSFFAPYKPFFVALFESVPIYVITRISYRAFWIEDVFRWNTPPGILYKVLEHGEILEPYRAKDRWLISVKMSKGWESEVLHKEFHKLFANVILTIIAKIGCPVENWSESFLLESQFWFVENADFYLLFWVIVSYLIRVKKFLENLLKNEPILVEKL